MVMIEYTDAQFYLIIMLFIYSFFILLAEWKRDFAYFYISALLGLPLGVYLLVAENEVLSYLFGTCIILISCYLSYIGLTLWRTIRKE